MANCKNCGAELRDGAGFCSVCGAPVIKVVFCSNCGAELDAGDKFCYVCGAAVKNSNPDVQQAAFTAPATDWKDSYPNALSFYSKRERALSISDRAAVFGDGYNLYRVDRDMNFISRESSVDRVVQTKSGVRGLNWRYTDNVLELREYDDDLKLLSKKDITSLPDDDLSKALYAMSEHFVFTCIWLPAEDDDGNTVAQDMVITRVNVDTGDVVKITNPAADGEALIAVYDMVADGGDLYIETAVNAGEDTVDICARVDFDAEKLTTIWKNLSYVRDGKPRFYDFSKGIMWTYPNKKEMQNHEWNVFDSERYMIPRKIGYDMPILKNFDIWKLDKNEASYLFYFDGKNAYSRSDYYHFKMLDKLGNASEDWNGTSHGRTETAVIWPEADKVIADILADYYYTAYPLESYVRPSEGTAQKLEV